MFRPFSEWLRAIRLGFRYKLWMAFFCHFYWFFQSMWNGIILMDKSFWKRCFVMLPSCYPASNLLVHKSVLVARPIETKNWIRVKKCIQFSSFFSQKYIEFDKITNDSPLNKKISRSFSLNMKNDLSNFIQIANV